MSVKQFKFVSPGVFLNEIDNSQLPNVGDEIGPLVIGRFKKGPSMQPVLIEDTDKLEQTFGLPDPGLSSGDAWRDGTYTSPTYGGYAAYSWLKNSNVPITVVRLLGEQNDDATSDIGEAGWNAGQITEENYGGAYGLFVFPSSSSATNITGALAATWYFPNEMSGGIMLSGTIAGAITETTASNALLFESANQALTVVMSSGSTLLDAKKITFDMDTVRDKFNMDPTLTNTSVTLAADQKTYWLGETYERAAKEIIGTGEYWGMIVGLEDSAGTVEKSNYNMSRQVAKTGWFFSQDVGTATSFVPSAMQKLFRLHTLDSGEHDQRNYKVTIQDIKAAKVTGDYGTFTIQIRDIRDLDSKKNIVERYSNCSLNPAADNYIAKKIGDQYYEWDSTRNVLLEKGTFENKSRLVRVEVDTVVASGRANKVFLPFGVYGPEKIKDTVITEAVVTPDTLVVGSGSIYKDLVNWEEGTNEFSSSFATDFTSSLQFPSIPLVESNHPYGGTLKEDMHFGVDLLKSGSLTAFEGSVVDLVRSLPADGANPGSPIDSTFTEQSWYFTLDDIASGSVSANYDYTSGSRAAERSVTAISGWSNFLNNTTGLNRFTTVLYGGFDGLDITEREPLVNNTLLSGKTELTSYSFNTIKRAIRIVEDAEVVEYNVLTVPGLTNASLTDQVLDTCETRADALAIVDLPYEYTPETETTDNEDTRIGSVKDTVDDVKDRNINTSYGSSYYPWVMISDHLNGNVNLWVPPSIVALGTFASSDTEKDGAVWFAPAGFNRGGLDDGSSGFKVLQVRDRVYVADRDNLYENNINPIAKFAGEGIVIMGQKTLQRTPSALDRINVRRMLLYVKKEVSRIATSVLFEPNLEKTWARFRGPVEAMLSGVKADFGLADYKVILDKSTTTEDLVDRNIMYAKVLLKPAYAVEFIAVDFVVTNSGASFAD